MLLLKKQAVIACIADITERTEFSFSAAQVVKSIGLVVDIVLQIGINLKMARIQDDFTTYIVRVQSAGARSHRETAPDSRPSLFSFSILFSAS